MLIKVTEKCLTTDNKGQKVHALRHYVYDGIDGDFDDVIVDLENNFDIDKIIHCNDEFTGECLDSEVIKYERVLDYKETTRSLSEDIQVIVNNIDSGIVNINQVSRTLKALLKEYYNL